ncbi:MAG: TerB family tellurite resistance protein [Rhizobiales bacterium]|nr:TerB family tellurite resistance protein [Hyphomicrobiales bacterium]
MPAGPILPPPAPSGVSPLVAGLSFIIEYEDAAGRSRLRPVTVWSVRTGADGVPRLIVRSHDSKTSHDDGALRSFRLDRIKAVADLDGVVQEPLADFFRDALGLVWPVPGQKPADPKRDADRWAVIRKVTRDGGLTLLAAMAAADSDVSAEEIQVMLDHATRSCAAEGIALGDGEQARLRRSIARMRPTPEATAKAVAALAAEHRSTIEAVLAACLAVADADGFRHHREMTLLNSFSFNLTGKRLFDSA